MKKEQTLQKGFTLIEFMVAAILGLMILLAIGGAYLATQRVNETAATRVARQQELRLVGNFLIRDARIAGTFGCANLGALVIGGVNFDQQIAANKLQFNNDPSYFAFAPANADQRVYATRIVDAADGGGGSAWLEKINDTFVPVAGSQMIIFNYGTNTQPLLSTTLVGTNSLNAFTVEDTSTFTNTNNASARVVLSSCSRVDVLHRSQLQINAANKSVTITNSGNGGANINIPMYKTGVIYKEPPSSEGGAVESKSGTVHYTTQATISNLHTVAYVVGNVANDTQPPALYRFELLDASGTWSAPQLLAKNITSLTGRYIYIANCNPGAENEKFALSSDAFDKFGSDTVVPTAVQMTLTPSVTNTEVGGIYDEAVTNNTDVQPIVFNATMRGANTCAAQK